MMQDILADTYVWVKSLHVMAVIAWMAGLFYLPRLFVYHVEGLAKQGVAAGSDMDLLFRHQERLLLRAIMNPSMVVTWVAGLALVATPGIVNWSDVWPWTKAASVLGMTWFHHWLGLRRKDFLTGQNRLTGRDYRLMNEVPTVLMIVIVLSVIVKF
jgi:protoporphyrinogen IX oxidase